MNLNIQKFMNNNNKPSKRYRLYCPLNVTDESGNGYNMFQEKYLRCEENTIEHLCNIGSFMHWYQIVDIRNGYKVVKEVAPIN